MKKVKSIIQFIIIIVGLLLSIWSQSWLLIVIVFIVSVLSWCPSLHSNITQLSTKLSSFQQKVIEWCLAIITALIVLWFVQNFVFSFFLIRSTSMLPVFDVDELVVIDKLAYGSAVNKNNSTRYRRLKGYTKIKHGDIIALHFPEADTVFKDHKENYYFIKRKYEATKSYMSLLDSKLAYCKVSDRKPFIKRIVALPGDTLKIANGSLYVNNNYQPVNEYSINIYQIKSGVDSSVQNNILKQAFQQYYENGHQYVELQNKVIKNNAWDQYLIKVVDPMNRPSPYVFPFVRSYFWNASYMGPIIIPTKGKTVYLSLANLPLYKRIIESYEGNKLEVREQEIYINNICSKQYTFKMNYYWVAGDNKKHSFDSRYWGFVPENHIIGKIIMLTDKAS